MPSSPLHDPLAATVVVRVGAGPCRWTVPATDRCVSTLRRDVVAFAEEHAVAGAPVAALRVALGEALGNVVMHAFAPGTTGTVTVTLTVDAGEGEVRVRVCDDGRGMASRGDSPGLGLGMALIAKVADRIDLRAPLVGTGTDLGMAFSFGRPALLR